MNSGLELKLVNEANAIMFSRMKASTESCWTYLHNFKTEYKYGPFKLMDSSTFNTLNKSSHHKQTMHVGIKLSLEI